MTRTIADVLEQVGHPLGSRGRTTCPVHQGGNDQSFTYRETVWYCFACGKGGGVKALRELLLPPSTEEFEGGLEPLRQSPGDGGGYLDPSLRDSRPSVQLLRGSLEQKQALLEQLLDVHQRAMREMDQEIPWVLRHGGPELLEFAGLAWQQATYRLWMVEAILGCRCQ